MGRYLLRWRCDNPLMEMLSGLEAMVGEGMRARIRQRRPRPSNCWHLDEVFVRLCQLNGSERNSLAPWNSGRCDFAPSTANLMAHTRR